MADTGKRRETVDALPESAAYIDNGIVVGYRLKLTIERRKNVLKKIRKKNIVFLKKCCILLLKK